MIYSFRLKDGSSFCDFFNNADKLGDICMCNKDLFINTSLNKNTVFKKINATEIKEINKLNYKEIQSDVVKKWCSDIFYKQQIEEFEKSEECQERLKNINSLLDKIEKEGGVSVGTEEETTESAK